MTYPSQPNRGAPRPPPKPMPQGRDPGHLVSGQFPMRRPWSAWEAPGAMRATDLDSSSVTSALLSPSPLTYKMEVTAHLPHWAVQGTKGDSECKCLFQDLAHSKCSTKGRYLSVWAGGLSKKIWALEPDMP